jgi:hypothetical protein
MPRDYGFRILKGPSNYTIHARKVSRRRYSSKVSLAMPARGLKELEASEYAAASRLTW